jgi:hypothetical protein
MGANVHLILTNTISVDYLRPVKFSALLSIIYLLPLQPPPEGGEGVEAKENK